MKGVAGLLLVRLPLQGGGSFEPQRSVSALFSIIIRTTWSKYAPVIEAFVDCSVGAADCRVLALPSGAGPRIAGVDEARLMRTRVRSRTEVRRIAHCPKDVNKSSF